MPALIHGKSLDAWLEEYPELERLIAAAPLLWTNPGYGPHEDDCDGLTDADIDAAAARLQRFAPYLARVFAETRERGGLIESPLRPAPALQREVAAVFDWQLPGRLLLKCDNELAISGSIKARGGIYEVLKRAESLAVQHGLVSPQDDYARFDSDEFRNLFETSSIAVGSTGNLGLGIGIIAARLGFRVSVHMSADARRWKKDLLRARGVDVVEYESDYGEAVRQGRAQAAADPVMHFVDDENSADLFLGYAVAARRLRLQLEELGIEVGAERPLFVYLPCGVGGGPGGVTFGLKREFGADVHCFFAEPVNSPCMLLGLLTGLHDAVDVRDFGLDNNTEADGLAVARPSGFVGRLLRRDISGVYTVQDEMLFRLLRIARDSENLALEPSAAAGLSGPAMLLQSQAGREYLQRHALSDKMERASHVAWLTGGGMVPAAEFEDYYRRGMFSCG